MSARRGLRAARRHSSELEFQGQQYRTRPADLIHGDQPARGPARAQAFGEGLRRDEPRGRVGEVRVVENVVSVGPQLRLEPARELEPTTEREVKLRGAEAPQGVAPERPFAPAVRRERRRVDVPAARYY